PTQAAFLKSASRSSLATVLASSVFMLETTENSTKPPFLRDTRKYCEIRAPAESSQEEKPRNTTSLSTSSLVRPEANLPPQSLALATPDCFTLATQLASDGRSCAVWSSLNWNSCPCA